MITIKDISEPSLKYKEIAEAIKENATNFYDDLVKQANVSPEKNKTTCTDYYQKLEEVKQGENSTKKLKRKKKWLRFLEVICYIFIITIPFGILIHSKIKNKIDVEINDSINSTNKLQAAADDLLNQAKEQTEPLNSLFDWNMVAKLVSSTIPLIQLDRNFTNERFFELVEKYGYKSHEDENNISTIFVQSGSIYGNPFVIEKNYVQEMVDHLYTGTLVIHWTTTTRDSNGNTRTVHHTQTLVAHVTKPAPMYYYDTWLIYGNAAAPKLTFSRKPSDANSMSDDEMKRASIKFEKKLAKMARKDATFTAMGNSEFERMFCALDRDNEVEYRLLFTPLAQKNMLNLIKTKEPYGDDFFFFKRNGLNFIKTKHAQTFDYSNNPKMFKHFDISIGKETFINYSCQYAQSLYFDLAPLISIPLYQNYKDRDYIYKNKSKHNYTPLEIESLANAYDKSTFHLSKSTTDIILKAKYVSSKGSEDVVDINAYGFIAIPHTDLVPTLGGDGRMHAVPVLWYEYRPTASATTMKINSTDKNLHDFLLNNKNSRDNGIYYQKGLLSSLL